MATKKKTIVLTVEEKKQREEYAKKAKFYRTFKEEDMIKWCEENNQLEWLIAETNKIVKHKVYGQKRGLNKKGEWILKTDKDNVIGTVEEPITFVELKHNFFAKFMPDKLPTKSDKPVAETFRDRINKLKKK